MGVLAEREPERASKLERKIGMELLNEISCAIQLQPPVSFVCVCVLACANEEDRRDDDDGVRARHQNR
jgi:hypothetical protein